MPSESEAMSSNTDSVPLSCSSTYLQAPFLFHFLQLLVLYLRPGFLQCVKGGFVCDLPHDRVARPNYNYSMLAVLMSLVSEVLSSKLDAAKLAQDLKSLCGILGL